MYKQIILAILLSCSFSAYSQISIYGSAGVNSTGINLSSVSQNMTNFNDESYIQPFITLGIAAPVSNNMYWLGELSYSPSGYKLSNDSASTKIRYNMINFQTGLGYQLGSIRLEAGGFIGTSLSDQLNNESSSGWSEDFGLSEDITVGAFVGINLSVTKNIGIFARYYRGLTPTSKIHFTDLNGTTINSISEKINNLQFGVTVNLF